MPVDSPVVTITAQPDPKYPDTFACTVTHTDRRGFSFETVRTDPGKQGSSWGQVTHVT